MQRWTAILLALLFGGAVAVLFAQLGTPPDDARRVVVETGPAASSASAMPDLVAAEPPPAPEPVPAQSGGTLPEDAPKTVGFGVIQVPYRGAQFAGTSAPSKPEALEKARALLLEANTDFSSAAKKGDSASGADLGDVPRGILEPELEFILFTMKVGEVHDEPIDTPRGFWILRRTR